MFRRRSTWIVLTLYAMSMAAVVAGLVEMRKRTLSAYGGAEAAEAHAAWQAETQRQSRDDYDGPVRREAVRTAEPPALVLMRDHFAVIVVVCWLVATVLLAFLAFAVYGSFVRGQTTNQIAENSHSPAGGEES